MHFECLTPTDGWLTFYQPIRNAVWSICWGTEFKNPRGIEYRCFFFLPIAPRPLPPCLVVGQGFVAISHFTNHKRKTHTHTHTQKKTVKGELNVFSRELIELLITKKAIAYKSCWCDKIESSCMNGLHKV